MSDFQSQLDRLYRRILMMVTPVQITTTNDSGNVLTAQIGVSNTPEIIDTVPLLQYYGFHANPPPKTDAIAVFGGGERSNAVIVGTNDTKSRPRNYKPGEIGMFTNEGDTLKFARQQAVTLTAGNSFTANTKQATIKGTTGVTLDTPNTHHTGDVKSDGKVDANGGFWKNGVEMGTGGGGGGTVGPPGPAGPTGATGPAGEDGNTVLHGTGAPPTATGQDGDFYIDTTPHSMYGPKAGSWPTPGTSLIGPQGATGAQGAAGVPGPQGPTGATGAQGPQGVKGDTGTAGATGGVGPMGPQGAPGVAGPTGPTGPAASYQAGPGLAINSGTTPPTINVATPYLALSGGTLSGVLHVTPQATQLGGPAGSLSAPTNANTNLLLYNVSASNYAGIGAAPDGTMYVVTGTSTPATRLVVSPTGVGLGTGATAPSNNVTLISNATGSALGYPVRIGNNNNAAGDNVVLLGGGPNASDTTTKLIGFFDYNGNTLQGAITRNGTAAVAYGTSSDARLKERIVDSALGLDVLMRVRVRDYRMAGDERDQQGFVAQELAEIYPLAVSPGGDDPETEPWLVDYGRLTPLLVSAIQQQQREINELKRMVLGK